MVFGSGPNENGKPGIASSLDDAVSNTSGKVFVVDLMNLAKNQEVWSVDGLNFGKPLLAGHHVYSEIGTNTFISDIVSVDYDLDYFADALYFGTVKGSEILGWGGQLQRVELFDSSNSAHWVNSVLIDLGSVKQPITAAPTIGIDKAKNKWVFFGTGRFFSNSDIQNKDLQSYYGIKDKYIGVNRNNLLNVTNVDVYYDEAVTGLVGVTTFSELDLKISTMDGWLIDLKTETGLSVGHRNLGQAALLGEVLTFTSYLPSADVCQTEGTSELYAVYYKTGTAYKKPILDAIWHDDGDSIVEQNELQLRKRMSIGSGMALSPNIHVGSEDGAKAFIQTSKGGISIFQEDAPGLSKSVKSYWRQR
ncbi:MAG: hypothetical protein JZU65_00860 [Chlorobium sp.]|nr:hypothetical protein [Chlorobium sp.]